MLKSFFLKEASLVFLLAACSAPKAETINSPEEQNTNAPTAGKVIKPAVVTDTVQFDSDDPAIWVNPVNPEKSLIIGTDKDAQGGLYVFNLEGKIIPEKTVKNLQRPNNVDVEYGLLLNGKPTDIAVATERMTHKLRIFSVPDMKPIDKGGLEMFVGETEEGYRDIMGVSLYRNKAGKVYAIVGRKVGPQDGTYLWQYLLEDDGTGHVKATLVRKFGEYSGKKEIEAIAVDDALGYVYYSDEGTGVRQYFADPERGNKQLSLFATQDFTRDHEGISIYALTDSTGYILVSDQEVNRFMVFTREGTAANPYEHRFLKSVNVSAINSDGSETVAVPLGKKFKHGLFVAMSTDKTFHFYPWEDIAEKDLKMIHK